MKIEMVSFFIGRSDGNADIQWYFENKAAMAATQKLFKENKIEGIDLIYKPR